MTTKLAVMVNLSVLEKKASWGQ